MAGFTPAPEPGVESGTIAIWHGTLANIPSGWVLCDGTNSTPDLREKFLKGVAAAAEPGDTGGASSHSHNCSETSGNLCEGTSYYASDVASNEPPFYTVAYIMKT